MPNFTEITGLHPEWRPPIDDSDLHGIVRVRQRAVRESNAFPQGTPLSQEERQEIIKAIPDLDGPNAAAERLSFFIQNGRMNSLDLARTEVMGGDWKTGRELDERVVDYLAELHANDGLQRKIGVAVIDIIDKSNSEADPVSNITSLSERLKEQGRLWVVRRRNVARIAFRAAKVAVVRKVSDFELSVLNDDTYKGVNSEKEADLFRLSAQVLAGGGLVTHPYHQRLLTIVREGIERGIATQAPYLRPISVSYHIAMKPQNGMAAKTAPLQRAGGES